MNEGLETCINCGREASFTFAAGCSFCGWLHDDAPPPPPDPPECPLNPDGKHMPHWSGVTGDPETYYCRRILVTCYYCGTNGQLRIDPEAVEWRKPE
jgi:hypothetical protein